jgi:predicted ATPase/DNA-binding XRE family transcriptional regulator
MSASETFGQLLKYYRVRQGLTQDTLAERVGCATQTVRKIEAGQRRPSFAMAARFAQMLELAPDERAAWLLATRQGASNAAVAPEAAPQPADPMAIAPGPTHELIGRAAELALLQQLIERANTRLLTIIGPGGVGKTSLARALVAAVAPRFAHGIALVSLAALSDGGLVLSTIAQSLGLHEAASDPRAMLRSYLQERQFLLVLDNFEHLLDTASEVTTLLEACPHLTVLVTSRAPLQLRDEQVYPLGPLALPPEQPLPTLAELGGVPAVQLFVQCAQQADPQFALTPQNAATVAALCRRLDGLPLALELAAPRVRLLGLPTLLARLDRSLPLLSSGARDLPARQRTIEAAVRWSYDLLAPPEQALFRRLSVFAGGADLAAIEAVGAATPDEQWAVLPQLSALVAQSLVLLVDDGGQGGVRYRLLEPVRQYAQAQLSGAGEEQAARMHHAEHYALWLQGRVGALKSAQQARVIAEIVADIDNLRVARHYALTHQRTDLLLRMNDKSVLLYFYELRSWYYEAQAVCRQTMAMLEALPSRTPAEEALLGNQIGCLGWFTFRCGEAAAGRALLEASISKLRPLGNASYLLDSIIQLIFLAHTVGDAQTMLAFEDEALAVARQANDPWALAQVIYQRAFVYMEHAPQQAYARFREGLPQLRELGERYLLGLALLYTGELALGDGGVAAAEQYFAEGLAISHEIGNAFIEVMTHNGLAQVACAKQHWDAAMEHSWRALVRTRDIGDGWSRVKILLTLGLAEAGSGHHHAARDTWRSTIGEALAAGLLPFAVEAFVGLAELDSQTTADKVTLLALVAYVRNHPAGNRQVGERVGKLWQHLASPTIARAAEHLAQRLASMDLSQVLMAYIQGQAPALLDAAAQP